MNHLTDILTQALQKNIITQSQYEQIITLTNDDKVWHASKQTDEQPRFVMAHLLYYFGGLIAIGAMSLFITLGFEMYGGVGIMVISLCYAIVGMLLAYRFKNQGLMIPHSILLAFVLVLVPLFVFGLQQTLGVWGDDYKHYRDYHTWVSWQWIIMELATLIVGALMMYKYRRAFVMLPIAVTLWYLSMDVVPFFNNGELDWELRRVVSLYFGIAITCLALFVNFRQIETTANTKVNNKQDYAFWLYIVGAICFWCGLTFNTSASEWQSFGYFVINLGMMLFGLLIRRRVFVVLAGLGCCAYFGHLAWDVFANSLIFPLILTLIGLVIIYLGVTWQRHENAISNRLMRLLPQKLRTSLKRLQNTF